MTLMPSRRLLLLSFCTLSTRRVISTQSSCNLHKRIVNAVRGAFVADAASMGTHWHYSVPELLALLPDATAPEFQDPPTPNFYDSQDFPGHYHAGMLSPYGEQLLFVAEYCASNKDVDPETMSAAMYEWAKTFGGRPDHATVQFMENMSKKKIKVVNGPTVELMMNKVVPITCMYAGKPELKKKLADAIRVHQNNRNAVAFGTAASRMLEAVLMGKDIREALHHVEDIEYEPYPVRDAMKTAQRGVDKSLSDLLGELGTGGRSCLLPPSFIGPTQQLHKAAEANSAKNLYKQAIRENILAGGDTCGRGILVGAILGAATDGPPKRWVEKVDKNVMKKINAAANTIADIAVGKVES